MLNKLKDDILRLLKEDEEFRYAIIGLLGLQRLENAIARLTDSHIELKNIVVRLIDTQANMESRLSKVEEAVVRLNDAIARLTDSHIELKNIVVRLIDTQANMESRLSKVEEAVIELMNTVMELRNITAKLADIQARQEERLTKVEERLSKVEDRLVRIEERQEEHDKKFNAILAELSDLKSKHDKRLSNIEAYMERTSLTLEEEAREVIAYRLREKGIAIMDISSLILEDMEIDIYATDTNLCLIGEASTRVSAKLIEEVDKDIEKLCKKYPNYLKDKVIKTVYGMQILPDAVDEAKKRRIWLVTANKEITELGI
jgi:chromosome segregation ATPase